MNERIKELMRQAGTDTSGKWMSIDNTEALVGLVIKEVCEVLQNEDIRHDVYGYGQGFLHKKIKERFGVEL